jgi:large subunit ribosomal protein L25
MAQVVFTAKKRSGKGSADSRRLRKAGKTPAVMYGHTNGTTSIELDTAQFMTGIRGVSESTIVKLEIDGASHQAFVKDTQRNIVDGMVLHVDFYEIDPNSVLRARVPVHVYGNPIGVRDGGVLETPLHDIEVECMPNVLPERIQVDIANLGVNQSIHVRDLKLGDGVKLISGEDQVVALVKYTRDVVSITATDEAAAAPADKK